MKKISHKSWLRACIFLLPLMVVFFVIGSMKWVAPIAAGAENLLTNGDFETGTIDPWQGITEAQLTSSAYSGNHAVHLTEALDVFQRWITVEPGKTYLLTTWFKWHEFSGDGWGYDRLTVIDSDWKTLASIDNIHRKVQHDQWTKLALTFVAQTSRAQVSFGVFGPKDRVSLYFDDLVLVERGHNVPPYADPTSSVVFGHAPLTVDLTANAQDPDGAIVRYHWDLGDGSIATIENPRHTFLSAGDYSVTLRVWDNDGEAISRSLSIEVFDEVAPAVDILLPTAEERLSTTVASTTLAGGAIVQSSDALVSLVWDNLNTGKAGFIELPSDEHERWNSQEIALKPGKNEILVTGTDSAGRIGTDSIILYRQVSGPVISDIKVASTEVRVYEKYEVTFDLQTVADYLFFAYDENPPAGVSAGAGVTVEALVTTPSGETLIQPGFYYTEVTRTDTDGRVRYEETGATRWAVRFSPQKTGRHDVSLHIRDASGSIVVPVGSLNALPAIRQGFIGVSEADSRYFEFSNGDLFWPIGPANDNDPSKNAGTGLNFARPWMAGRGAYSTNWARWMSTEKQHGNEGFDSNLSFRQSYPSHELSQVIHYPSATRMWISSFLNNDLSHRIKPDTDYLIKIRLKTMDIQGPVDPAHPYGFMIKTHGWPSETLEEDLRPYPSLIPIISQDRDWHTVLSVYRTTDRDAKDSLSLYLDNVTAGQVNIDEFSMREILADGSLGGEQIRDSRADLHTRVDQRAAAYFDWQVAQAEEYETYFKYVVHDKRDWIQNHLADDGTFVDWGSGYYQPEDTKANWLLRQWWRYLAARWGYSTAIFSWELNNEGSPDSVAHYRTAQQFAKFMHETGAHPHLATTSFWCCWRPEFWGDDENYPDIDYADIHYYSGDDTLSDGTLAAYDAAAFHAETSMMTYLSGIGKPVIRGETGLARPGQDIFAYLEQPNPGIWYHNLLWAQLGPGGMSDPNYWWSSHRQQIPIGDISQTFNRFVHALDINKGGYIDLNPHIDNPNIRAYGQKNLTTGNAHLWIQNKYHTWRNAMGVDNPIPIAPESGALTIQMQADTPYTVEWWDTWAGAITKTDTVRSDSSGRIVLMLTDLESDLAVKLTRAAVSSPFTITAEAGPGGSIAPSGSVRVDQGDDATFVIIPDEGYAVADILVDGASVGPAQSWVFSQVAADHSIAVHFREAWGAIGEHDWPTRARTMARSASVSYELPLDGGRLHLQWSRFFGERIEVEMEPTVVGDTVFIGVMNGKLYALNRATGATRWVYQADGPITDTPTIAEIQGQLRVIFGAIDGIVYCLDAKTGAEVWRFTADGPLMSTPVVHDDTVLIGSLGNTFYALDARDAPSEGARLRWSYRTSGPISCTPALGPTDSGMGVFFSTGDNVGYGFLIDGTLLWRNQMEGVFTKRTYAVYGQGANGRRVVMFVTRKPGAEYSEPMEDLPAILQGVRQPGPVVIDAWADYYVQYPRRRPLYYFDAASGQDLWQPSVDKARYTPMYIPYWGAYSPMVDAQGYAWFAASGSGGDHALDHDTRLWKIDLDTGTYTHVAHQAEFQMRFDEVGRGTLVGTKYYQTISEDIGYYDLASMQMNTAVFGNGFGNHRMPLEFDELLSDGKTIFGGMHKHFGRFASSGPGGFGGAVDAMSPLVVAGETAFVTAWGHLYALSAQRTVPIRHYQDLDLTSPPASALTRDAVRQMLGESVQRIVDDGAHLPPVSRLWSFYKSAPLGAFWHEGEVIRTLAETIPHLDEPLKAQLKAHLQGQVQAHLLNPKRYEYRYACWNYDSGQLEDPCTRQGVYAGWFWNNPNLIAERIYALFKYAQMTGDWELVADQWSFISGSSVYRQMTGGGNSFDDEVGFFLWPEWIAGNWNPNRQLAAMLAMREMATRVGDGVIEAEAGRYLERMLQMRPVWGQYVQALYDSGQLQRQSYDDPADWGYHLAISPMPVEGYLDRENDFRHPYFIGRNADGSLLVKVQGSGVPGSVRDIYPYYLVGYHPFYEECNPLVREYLAAQVASHVAAIEIMNPWWYMGDYGHQVAVGLHEDDSFSPVAASDLFQAKAYILGWTFAELAPYLPWTFGNYGHRDIFRLQNLVALMRAPDEAAPVEPQTFSKSLSSGWHLLAYPYTLPADGDWLTSLAGAYDQVLLPAQDDPSALEIYDSDDPTHRSRLPLGFWIHLTTPAEWTLSGLPMAQEQISLQPGLNLLRWPAGFANDLPQALSSIKGYYRGLWVHDGDSPDKRWQVFIADEGFGQLNRVHALQPGRAYWIDVIQDCTLVLP